MVDHLPSVAETPSVLKGMPPAGTSVMLYTPIKLDPFDVFGWDIPTPTERNKNINHLQGAVLPAASVLNNRYRHIAAIILVARQIGEIIPYGTSQLNEARDLFAAPGGYIAIIMILRIPTELDSNLIAAHGYQTGVPGKRYG